MKKSRKGFTLVELIVTVAILALIMGVLGGAMMSTFQAFTNHQVRQRRHANESQARLALLSMVRDIRLSYRVMPPEGNVLVLRARLGTGAYRTITYSLNGQLLTRSYSAPHGSEGVGSDAVPPPGGGTWPAWPVSSVPASVLYAVVLQDCDTDPLTIRLWIDVEIDGPFFINPANPSFETTVAVQRIPAP